MFLCLSVCLVAARLLLLSPLFSLFRFRVFVAFHSPFPCLSQSPLCLQIQKDIAGFVSQKEATAEQLLQVKTDFSRATLELRMCEKERDNAVKAWEEQVRMKEQVTKEVDAAKATLEDLKTQKESVSKSLLTLDEQYKSVRMCALFLCLCLSVSVCLAVYVRLCLSFSLCVSLLSACLLSLFLSCFLFVSLCLFLRVCL